MDTTTGEIQFLPWGARVAGDVACLMFVPPESGSELSHRGTESCIHAQNHRTRQSVTRKSKIFLKSPPTGDSSARIEHPKLDSPLSVDTTTGETHVVRSSPALASPRAHAGGHEQAHHTWRGHRRE